MLISSQVIWDIRLTSGTPNLVSEELQVLRTVLGLRIRTYWRIKDFRQSIVLISWFEIFLIKKVSCTLILIELIAPFSFFYNKSKISLVFKSVGVCMWERTGVDTVQLPSYIHIIYRYIYLRIYMYIFICIYKFSYDISMK